MLPVYQLQRHLHIYRLDDGAEHHQREEGKFEVRWGKGEKEEFTYFLKAFIFYLKAEHEASLWDVTAEPKLVEMKVQFAFLGEERRE
jgi:hypothetical protein